jgi:hypothetical protein
MSEFYTYMYINPITDMPFYVGKGKDDRANTHIKGHSTGNKYVKGRIRNLRDEGIEPTIEITHTTNEVAALWLERTLIAAYGRKDNGTGCLLNHTDGGEGLSGHIFSAEHRARIGAKHKGKTISEELRKKWSEQRKGRPSSFKGKKFTDEAKEKIRVSKIGKQISAETRTKISASMKAFKASNKTIKEAA